MRLQNSSHGINSLSNITKGGIIDANAGQIIGGDFKAVGKLAKFVVKLRIVKEMEIEVELKQKNVA